MANVEPVVGTTGTGTGSGPSGRLSRGGPHLIVLATLVALGLVIPSAVLTGAAAPPVSGLADPGSIVRWGLPLVRAVQDVAAAATIGLLLMGGFLVPEGPRSARRATAARYAATTAGIWALSAVVVTVLGFADLAGIAPSAPRFGAQLWSSVWSVETLRVSAISALIACVVALGSSVARSRGAQAWLCVLGVLAMLPLALGGHAGGSADHDTAVNSLAFHLVGVVLWVGGLLALVALRPVLGKATAVTVERYSTLAGWCFCLVAFSGVLNAWVRVGHLSGLATGYGLLVIGKAVALVLLGLAGWQQRRSIVTRLREHKAARGAFIRLATVEAVVMGAAIGMATVLARSAPPVPDVLPGDRADAVLALTGYPRPAPLHWSSWVTAWEMEWLFSTVTALALGLYLAGVVKMHRRGDRWPVGRTVSWVAGWLLFAYLTNGAPAVYGRVMFSVHMSLHMTLSMVVPILLVLAAPVTLALRTLPARHDKTLGPREVVLAIVHSKFLNVLGNPVIAAILFYGSLLAFYYTGLLQLALTTHTGHVLMVVHFLLTGYLFVWVLIGVDPGPRRWSPMLRLLVLLVTISAHVFFGLALMSGNDLLAGDFFRQLHLSWVSSPIRDQQIGGAVTWGSGEVPSLLLALLVTVAWVRSDAAETRRLDRKADRDHDADLRAYNEHLARLAAADRAMEAAQAARRIQRASGATHSDRDPSDRHPSPKD